MQKIKLPFWMDKGELAKIAHLFERWWYWVLNTLKFPFETQDEEKCSEQVLNLIAYQRDITRFEGEPLELFRKRVKYAFLNAKDAGSVVGFKRIFERLGIGYIDLKERLPNIDWDIIKIYVTDQQVTRNNQLLMHIIRQYGRTCRRYDYEVVSVMPVYLHSGTIEHETQTFFATLKTIEMCLFYGTTEQNQTTFFAKL